jgi:DNA (cytosine-5)-methyltransferase 1
MVNKLGKRIKGISLFAGAGVGEVYLKDIGIDIVVANELIENRAKFYEHLYPYSEMIIGDIRDKEVKEEIEKYISSDTKLLLATPPCQGVSSLGKNKLQLHYEKDNRNFLIFETFYFIDKYQFDYVLIENVA